MAAIYNPILQTWSDERPDLQTPPAGALGPGNFDADDPRGTPEYLMGLGSFGPGSPTPSPSRTFPSNPEYPDQVRWVYDTHDPRGHPEVIGELMPGENVTSDDARVGFEDARPWRVFTDDPRGSPETVGSFGPGSPNPNPDTIYRSGPHEPGYTYWDVYAGTYNPRGQPEHVGFLRGIGRMLGFDSTGPGSEYPAGNRTFDSTADDLHQWNVHAGNFDPTGEPERVGALLGTEGDGNPLTDDPPPSQPPFAGPVLPSGYTGPVETYEDPVTGFRLARPGNPPATLQPPMPGAMGLFRGGSGLGRALGLGSLGQWWNPISWIQAGYTAVTNVNSAASDIINAINVANADLNAIDTDLQAVKGYLLGLWKEFAAYRTDFQAAMKNLESFLTGAGATIETALDNLQLTTSSLVSMLTTVETTLETFVSNAENEAQLVYGWFQQETAVWQEYLTEFNQNMENLQSAASTIATDLHALRQNVDNLTDVYSNFLTTFEQELQSGPTLTLPSNPLSIFGVGAQEVGAVAAPAVSADVSSEVSKNQDALTQLQQKASAANLSAPVSNVPALVKQLTSTAVPRGTVPGVGPAQYSAPTSTPYSATAVQALAKGFASIVRAADAVVSIENRLIQLSNTVSTSTTALTANMKSQTAALTAIHQELQALNASLSPSSSTSGIGALGEALYLVKKGRR